MVPTIDNAIFAEVIQAFSDSVDAQGFTILVATHGYDLEREYAVLRKLLEHRVDGVALIGIDHSDETYNLIESQAVPAITIWNYDAESRLSCVGADNRLAGRLAAEHLLSLGHREIAVLFPPVEDNDRARARRDAALSVLKTHCAEPPPIWTLEARYSLSDGKEAVETLLKSSRRPTALLCGNDVLATGAIHAAHRSGLAIPQDMSIIGIGDFQGSKEMEPPLSTIRLPAQTIGQIAGEKLSQSIVEEDHAVRRTSCAIELMARGTTAKLPGP